MTKYYKDICHAWTVEDGIIKIQVTYGDGVTPEIAVRNYAREAQERQEEITHEQFMQLFEQTSKRIFAFLPMPLFNYPVKIHWITDVNAVVEEHSGGVLKYKCENESLPDGAEEAVERDLSNHLDESTGSTDDLPF